MSRIDTHQHLLYPERFTHEWTAGIPALAGHAFTLADYQHAVEDCGITGSIFVEGDVPPAQQAAEAALFCRLAEDPANRLLGVIASCRPEHPDFAAHLAAIQHPRLVGLRRILHTQPDELSTSTTFRDNVNSLGSEGLTFDICVLARQLPLAIALVDACQDTQFILDHCGVPAVAADQLDPWWADLRELSRRPNVACKISGIIAYADPARITAQALRPFVEHCVEAFGWGRLVFGSDWPVCNLTAGLGAWIKLLDEILASAELADRAKFDHLNATRIYGLMV